MAIAAVSLSRFSHYKEDLYMEEIIECIEPTVDVVEVIRPIYNFKAK